MKYTSIYIMAALAFAVSPLAYAHDGEHAVAQAGEQQESRTMPKETRMATTTADKPAHRATTTPDKAAQGSPRADRATTTEARKDAFKARQAEIASSTDARRADIEKRIAEKKLKISDDTHKRLVEKVANIKTRLTAATAKLENNIQKVEARIQILAARGVDVAEARRQIGIAKDALADVRTQIAAIDTDAEFAITDAKPKEAWQAFRLSFKEIQADMHMVTASIHDAVAALKLAVRAVEGEEGASGAVRENAQEKKDTATSTEGGVTQ